ncbi:MAG: DUF2330 domain-containing protein [Chloroflexi bacterium]|nr:MAG: hypothetical protein CUN54_08370 [Phototrophicales bacterium]RMF78054.1 MAG: DUF2330 domain-containing protein [Chloroflexota bacterium]
MFRFRWLVLLMMVMTGIVIVPSAAACGGLFCQNSPVNQNAERIIFTMNDDDTVSAYVQINYTGSAMDFSWVVPVPSVPEVDVAEIASFDELSNLTAPIFIPPLQPQCLFEQRELRADSADEVVMESAPLDDVQVLATGTAGPYAFDVVTSENSDALIIWLRTNNYVITEQMEPLIRVYTDEGMNFLAMKLQPEQGAQDIQPVKMTYTADSPTIPLRLTAVAANPNMSIFTWVFADAPVAPANYELITIDDADIRGDFFQPGGTNYQPLVDAAVDRFEGRAFITEYAQTTTDFLTTMRPSDPLVVELVREYDYVTRFFGRMSPEEMTLDPTFVIDAEMQPVSNVHDLSSADPEVFWGCSDSSGFDPSGIDTAQAVPLFLSVGLIGLGITLRRGRRRQQSDVFNDIVA